MLIKHDKTVRNKWSIFKSVKQNRKKFLVFLTIDQREDMCVIYHLSNKSKHVDTLWCNYVKLQNELTYNSTSKMDKVHPSIVDNILGIRFDGTEDNAQVSVPSIDRYKLFIKQEESGPELWYMNSEEAIRIFNVHLSGFSMIPPSIGHITLNGYRIMDDGKKQIVCERMPLSKHVKSMDLLTISKMYNFMQ